MENAKVHKRVLSVTNNSGNTRWVYRMSKVVSVAISNLGTSPEPLYVGIGEDESSKFPLLPGQSVSLGPDGTGRLWDGQDLKLGFKQAAVAPLFNQAIVVITVDTGEIIC